MAAHIAKPSWPTAQRGHPLARNMSAEWAFYEGSGLTLNSVFAPNAAGTLTTTTTLPQWVGGRFGWELDFNSSTSQRHVALPTFRSTTFTPPMTLLCTARATSAPGTTTYKTLVQFRGASAGYGIFAGNSFHAVASTWNNVVGEYDLNSGINVTVDVQFSVASVVTSNAITTLFYDATNGFKSAAFSETNNAITLANSNSWWIGDDASLATGREWTGTISHVALLEYAMGQNEFMKYAFDPFSMYRPRSKWWETVPPTVATGTEDDLIPMTGGGLIVPAGAYAATALYRNRKIDRRTFLSLIGWNRE